MIVVVKNTSGTMQFKGWSVATETNVITAKEQDYTLIDCLCAIEKDFIELAFIRENDSDWKVFYIRDTEIYDVEILKDGVLVDVEFLKIGVEVKINWLDVYNVSGFGKYVVRIKETHFGIETITDSHIFNVQPFNSVRAKDTVRIEIEPKGITKNGEDWSKCEQINMLRVTGNVYNKTHDIEVVNIETGAGELIDVQKSKTANWTIEIHYLPYSISNFITENAIFAKWYVTTYNYFQHENLLKKAVNIESVEGLDVNTIHQTFKIQVKEFIKKIHKTFV